MTIVLSEHATAHARTAASRLMSGSDNGRPSKGSAALAVLRSERQYRCLTPIALRNVRMMHLLERLAGKFNEANIPLMLLKGAALNLTAYRHPDERAMSDLDILVKPDDAKRALEILEGEGGLRRGELFQDDFFPRFYFETEYVIGSVFPVTIDVHVRPFGLLRYSRLVDDDAFWQRARQVRMGGATVFLPSAEDMLIHLTVHSTFHRCSQPKWIADIERWLRLYGDALDWGRFLLNVERMGLARAVAPSLLEAERQFGPLCPPTVRRRLASIRVSWRDRLAVRCALGDSPNPVVQGLVNLLTTPGVGFVLAYVRALLIPSHEYLEHWCVRHRFPWPRLARIARCLWPVVRFARPCWKHRASIEIRESAIHGLGVHAIREIGDGQVIALYRGRPTTENGIYTAWHKDDPGREARHEITGPLRYLNHSCQPNAVLSDFSLVALRPIRPGQEITIDYGPEACLCRADQPQRDHCATSSVSHETARQTPSSSTC